MPHTLDTIVSDPGEALTGNSGGIYFAEIQAKLPPFEYVEQAYHDLVGYDRHWTVQPNTANLPEPGVVATIRTPRGEEINLSTDPFVVGLNDNYVLLETFVGDGDGAETFDELFEADLEGTDVTHYLEEAGFYVVPKEACGATRPVRALAVLCVGDQAVYHYDRPSPELMTTIFAAADVILRGEIDDTPNGLLGN